MLPCTLFIFVICWVVNDVHTEKKWVMNQINLLNYSLRSHTLKVYRSCNVSCDVSCDDHMLCRDMSCDDHVMCRDMSCDVS